MLGISWATDPLHDAALAREIEVARQRRRAAGEVAPGVAAAARPDLPYRPSASSRTTMVLNSSLLNLGAASGAVLGGVLITLGGYEALGIGLPVVALVATVLAWWPAGVTRSMRGAAVSGSAAKPLRSLPHPPAANPLGSGGDGEGIRPPPLPSGLCPQSLPCARGGGGGRAH